jgi:hypothetical protein
MRILGPIARWNGSRGERLFERTAGIDAVRVDRQAGALAGEA